MRALSCVLGIILVLNVGVNCKLEEIFRWKQITYDLVQDETDSISFPDADTMQYLQQERSSALSSNYVAYNNVPMGVTRYKGKLFITMPRRRPGIPATLNYILLKSPKGSSPSLRAFPNYRMNELHPQNQSDSSRIISVYRTRLDVCNRLWFIDTGLLEYPNNARQVQRPSIWIIDLETEQIVNRFDIPESIVTRGNGLASITVDVERGDCGNAYGYIPDLATYHLYVYSLKQNQIWSFSHNYFHFDPLRGDFNIAGLPFQWDDGIFSITLGNKNPDGFRTAYFHPMASTSEFTVSTRVLRNETTATRSNHGNDFKFIGMRGDNSNSAMHDFDSNTGVIFYSQVATNGVSCWNTAKPLVERNHVHIAHNDETMIYPSDLNVDQEGTIWVITNSMPIFIYSNLNPNVYNFRVWSQTVQETIKGTECGGSHERSRPIYH